MTNTVRFLTMDPDPSKAHSREYQHQAIDAEIKSLEESIHALRRRNTLTPISALPTEIIAAIFFLLRLPSIHLALHVAHVCHRWREIALDQPLFWTHIDFTTVSPAGATEILARARMAPLYLEAKVSLRRWDGDRFVALQKELQTHISHISHLRISAEPLHLNSTLEGLISPAPTLERLSLSVEKSARPSRVSVPNTLFDATTPRLSSLELFNCNLSWKSPLFKGLKNLKISVGTRPSLTDWLDALNEMPRLKRLVLHSALPLAPRFPFDVERTITLPSLTRLDISASELDCGLALAHLVLPALTSLCVAAQSYHPTVGEVQNILRYVAQHAHGPQDTQPLQSMSIHGERTRIAILACPMPNIDVAERDAKNFARVAFSVTSEGRNNLDDHIRILDAAVAALPLDGLVTLTSPYDTRLDELFWRRHVSRWPLLKHVHLAPLPARGFRETLLQDNGGRDCPLLPSLTNIELIDTALSARRTLRLCDTLMKRVEQGVPLEVLDLRTCFATSFAVQILSEIVVNIWGPAELETEEPTQLTLGGGRGSFVSDDDSGVEYYCRGYNSYAVV